ncbi:hypothetical protein A3A39_03095 [Candidatus Kaiserbacteria bacterium RIFCSPLOWO2_01_FULL_54_13]|uniref:Cytidyltransferase-like domain-containing protein n=1 Tax=Candidatus Kaiserbacteria bacterium RIFCSPLOWO2_01_FULL_54_13 TaxID=1798512 RepID=A0A1F6F2K0_9BACT|nr:MAG: hypothetical protein A3A39_03095 [Candidatus Kaiserbacteria bacterium RIFCSPLOWO2_01_FULL_54_13]
MKKRKPLSVAVSGGFDPLHIGHARLFRAARKLGDKLVVILNNDNWLRAKKGFVFMPQKERAELIRTLPFVDTVVLTKHRRDDPDRSVCRVLEKIRPAIFANGGDRFAKNTPEVALCKRLGIKMIFNVGRGGKVQSSSWMIEAARKPASRTVRPWGSYFGWDSGKRWNLKTVYIRPGKRLSLQYHRGRSEHWILVEGDATATIQSPSGLMETYPLRLGESFRVGKGAVHRLESKRGGVIVEVALGHFDEEDIVRLEDDYGRAKNKSRSGRR